MNLRQLAAFRAIMMSGSVTAAASSMNLTQSAVSRLLGQLEDDLGILLFQRDRGRLISTPEASGILEEVDNVNGSIERLKRLASDYSQGVSSPEILRIAGPISASETILPDCLERFLKPRPGVIVETLFGATSEVERWVDKRQVDFGIARLYPNQRPSSIVSEISRSQMVCVLAEGHRLSENESIRPRDLSEVPLVLLGRFTPTRVALEALFRRDGVRRMNVRVETHSVGSACALAARNIGVAIVSSQFAFSFADKKIVVRPLRPTIAHRYAFMMPEGQSLSQAAQDLMQELRRGFQKTTGS